MGPRRKRSLLAQINITPLVDVMLVLLVIFMVTAPMLQHGVEVALPQVAAHSLGVAHEQVVLVVRADGAVLVNDTPTGVEELVEKLTPLLSADPNRPVHVRADQMVPYGRVARVMAAVQQAGAKKVGMVTEPIREGH